MRTEKGDKSGEYTTFPQADFSSTSATMGRRQDGFLSSAGAFVKELTFRLASHSTKQNISRLDRSREIGASVVGNSNTGDLARPAIYGRVFYTTIFGDTSRPIPLSASGYTP